MKKLSSYRRHILLKCWLLAIACQSVEGFASLAAPYEEQLVSRSSEEYWPVTNYEQKPEFNSWPEGAPVALRDLPAHEQREGNSFSPNDADLSPYSYPDEGFKQLLPSKQADWQHPSPAPDSPSSASPSNQQTPYYSQEWYPSSPISDPSNPTSGYFSQETNNFNFSWNPYENLSSYALDPTTPMNDTSCNQREQSAPSNDLSSIQMREKVLSAEQTSQAHSRLIETSWEDSPTKILPLPPKTENAFNSSSQAPAQATSYPFEHGHYDWNLPAQPTSEHFELPKEEMTAPAPFKSDLAPSATSDEATPSHSQEEQSQEPEESSPYPVQNAPTKPSEPKLPNEASSAETSKLEEHKPDLSQGKSNIKFVKKPEDVAAHKVISKQKGQASNIVGKQAVAAPEVGLIGFSPDSSLVDTEASSTAAPSNSKQILKSVFKSKRAAQSVATPAKTPSRLHTIDKEEEEEAAALIAQIVEPTDRPPEAESESTLDSDDSPVVVPLDPPAADTPTPDILPPAAAPVVPLPLPHPSTPIPADPATSVVPTATAHPPHQALKEISINFNNVAMIEYIRFISRISNKNFIFDDEDLQFNVTIVSEEPTSVENLMAALLQELKIRDLSLIEQGNNIIIHRNPRIRAPARIVVDEDASHSKESEIVTRVFRLNTLDPIKASEIIKPLLSDDALVEVLRDSNNLIITDIVTNVNKIAQLIASLDAPNSGVTVGQYVVRNAFVASLLDLATKILQPIAQGNPFVLVPHSATNSIYVVSNPFIVEKALAILENLDINEGRTKILSLEKLKLQDNQPDIHFPGQLGPGGLVPGGADGAVGLPNLPGGAGGLNIPGTPNYNPNLPSSYPLNYPGTLPGGRGPGGIGIEGYPGAGFEENREFSPGGISITPRWVQDLPAGHIERTLFFLYKLKYRRGDQIEIALRRIADSLQLAGTANADLVAAINSSQWLEASNSLIFTGTVPALDRIKELIVEVDAPLRQVFIEMLILDTTISDSLTYGVDWGTRFGGGSTAGGQSFLGLGSNIAAGLDAGTTTAVTAAEIAAGTAAGIPNPVANAILGADGFSLGIIGRHLTHNGTQFNTIGALVRALHEDTKINIIMNPKIVTEDNNTAEIFVGSTDRYKTQSISNDLGSVITNNFQFLDVGTTLRVTPLIGNNDVITLDIIEEVTNDSGAANVSSANASVVDVNLVPVLSKSRTTTRIHIPNGFFVILSGMISSTESRALNQIPCLGGIPLIGGVSKQKRNRDDKRNIMIFIRPLIVDTEEELENVTKRQQDVFREKSKFRRSWNYEIDEALDFFSIRRTDPDEIGCTIK